MEVHKHPHHVMHKKQWGEYLLEFLMLFLAVFLGFIAENIREGVVESHLEKQYMQSLINDVKADTAMLNDLIGNRTIRQSRLDSLTLLLNSDSAARFTNDIYFFVVTIPRVTIYQFTPNDGTIQQLKNAGGLHLIKKHRIADSIIKYDAAIRSLQRLDEQEQNIINIYREMAPKLFNGLELEKLSDADNLPVRINYNPPLIPDYKNSLNEFNNRLLSAKNLNKGYRREARRLLKQATNLLITLKKEYHLENE